MSLLLLSLLSLSLPARAECTLAALETTVDRAGEGALRRVDRWTWRVEPGVPDCDVVDVASPPGAPVVDLAVEIDRPDGRAPRLREPRITSVLRSADPGFGPSPGLRVHVPEVQAADLLSVTVTRAWPDAAPFSWWPGSRGALEVALLDAPADLAVDAPGRLEVADGRATLLLDGVEASQPEPLGVQPALLAAAEAPATEVHGLTALLLPADRPARAVAEPEAGATLSAWTLRGGAERLVAVPRDTRAAWCRDASGRPCPEVGGVAWSVGDGAWWGWVVSGAPASGDLGADSPPGPVRRATLLTPQADVAFASDRCVPSQTVLDQYLGGPASPELAELLAGSAPLSRAWTCELPGADTAGWRLRRLDGVPILPDRDATLAAVSWLARRTAIPEPALPAVLRVRKGDASAVGDVLDLFHAQVRVVEDVPFAPPLAPRRLTRARRSGWVTPWEGALLLTRYLRQLKLDAVPYAAAPAPTAAPGEAWPPPSALADAAALHPWTGALVRLVLPDGTEQWLDPACPTCGPDQLRPRWDRAPLLSDRFDAAPALRDGAESAWEATGPGTVRVRLVGPPAVELRHQLSRLPPRQRLAAAAAWLGGPGARIEAHEGLATAAEAVVVDLAFDAPR